jgi:spore coat protein U-like protein
VKKQISAALFVLSFGFIISGIAQAGTATSTLEVSATVGVTCSVSTTPINFGEYEAWKVVEGSITVNCTPGTPYSIALDAGQHGDFWGRKISNGTEFIQYRLNTPMWHYWGDDGATNGYETVSGYGTVWDRRLLYSRNWKTLAIYLPRASTLIRLE